MSSRLDLGGRRIKRIKLQPALLQPKIDPDGSLSECLRHTVAHCVVLNHLFFLAGDTDVECDSTDHEIRSVELVLHDNNSTHNRVPSTPQIPKLPQMM